MSIVWPVGLPQVVLKDNYQEKLGKNTIRSTVDVGPAKVRRRFTAVVENLTAALDLTKAQWITFRTFFYDTTAGGSLSFQWVHPSTGATVDMRFLDEPSMSPLGPDVVRVSMNLEVLP